MSVSYRLTCVEIDPDLREDFGLDPEGDGTLYTVDDEPMDSAAFTEWLRETAGLSPDEVDWESGGGMDISGQAFAYLDVEDGPVSGLDLPDNPNRDDLTRLSRWAGVAVKKLIVLDPDRDPFYAGSPKQVQQAAEFVSVTTGVNLNTHLRDLYYVLLSEERQVDWRWLQDASRSARDLGLIEPWAFPDKRTRALLLNERGEGEEIEYTITKPSFYVPTGALITEAKIDGFSALKAQPVRVLVLIEKDSDPLREEIVGPCHEAGAELRVTTGFSPKTLAARLAHEATFDPRPLVLFQITDADSSGEHMSAVTGRHLEFLSKRYELPPIYLDRIALTLAQVKQIEGLIGKEIPRAPDHTEREEGRVELNALPIFHPGWLGREVKRALRSVTVEIEEPEAELPEELQEMLDKAEQISKRLYGRIEDRLRLVERIVDDALDEWEPAAPEVEIPEPDLDRDWILDTGRDYLTQLNAYRRHGAVHRATEPLVLSERVCGCGCGESLAHMAVQARYVNAAHTQRARTRRSA